MEKFNTDEARIIFYAGEQQVIKCIQPDESCYIMQYSGFIYNYLYVRTAGDTAVYKSPNYPTILTLIGFVVLILFVFLTFFGLFFIMCLPNYGISGM